MMFTRPRLGRFQMSSVRDLRRSPAAEVTSRPGIVRQRAFCLSAPLQLAGREKEYLILQESFKRASVGKPEMIIVTGAMGQGKSFFVNQCMGRLISNKELFLTGKCYRFMRTEPFYCITEILSKCWDQLSGQMDQIEHEVSDVLDRDGWILAQILPCLRPLVGNQKQQPELSCKERHGRLKAVLRRFIRTITSHVPLVFYMEGLQWVDEASLELVQALITDKKIRGLLVICSYRDTECDELDEYFRKIKDRASISCVKINPLSLPDTISMVSQNLNAPQDKVSTISNFVHKHTNGNPCFALRLLCHLKSKEFLVLDDDSGDWIMTEGLNLPSTLLDLLVEDMLQLPQHARDLLARAAAIGFYFDNITINTVMFKCLASDSFDSLPCFKKNKCINSALDTLIQRDYIIPVGNMGHQFTHENLCSAAYEMLPQDTRASIHLQIGRALLKNAKVRKRSRRWSVIERNGGGRRKSRLVGCPGFLSKDRIAEFIDRQLCLIADQLNLGMELITCPSERSELINLNLQVAKLHIHSASWKLASEYIQTGIVLLGQDKWKEHHEQAVQLYALSAGVEFFKGDHAAMDRRAGSMLKNGDDIIGVTVDDHMATIQALQAKCHNGQNPENDLARLGFPIRQTKSGLWRFFHRRRKVLPMAQPCKY